MSFSILPAILSDEGNHFYEVSRKWQPKGLLPSVLKTNLLKDVLGRFNRLTLAEGEIQSLPRSARYIQILRRMRLTIKEAQFTWRSDDLRFITAITTFLQDFGLLLRFFREDQARGAFG